MKQTDTPKSISWTFLHGLGDAPNSARLLGHELRKRGDEFDAPDLNTVWSRHQDASELATDRLANALVSGALACRGVENSSSRRFLVGHSVGAFVALAIAELSSAFTGLVLLEGSLRAADLSAVQKYTDPEDPDRGRLCLISELSHATDETGRIAEYRENVAGTHPDLFHGLATELVGRQDVAWRRLSRLVIPVLYIAGALSPGASPAQLMPLRGLEAVEVIVVPDAAHWVHIDAPMVVASHMKRWANAICARESQ